MFSGILGNEPIKAYLQKAIVENRLAQTLLFAGPDGIGKSLFAKAVAAALLGKNGSPDLHVYGPEGKSGLYAIDTIRELIAEDHEASFEGQGKVFLLEDAERMQPASANALLKTLEEPNPETTFILLTSNEKEILPTILSRCTVLHFQPLTEEMIASLLHEKGHPKRLAKLAHGSAGRAFELAEHEGVEEQRKLLFELMAKRPSYPELALHLSKFDEKEEEDPVKAARRVEHLFASVLMWHRDQHLRQIGAREELLFFPDEPKMDPVSLPQIEKAIDQARMAVQRNMKLSVCLTKLLTKLA
ncbi:MAG: AAA family ATPase [Parachlamydiales bacterium]|nr:AAA family ATPase [Parachlamydiales bacterium]